MTDKIDTLKESDRFLKAMALMEFVGNGVTTNLLANLYYGEVNLTIITEETLKKEDIDRIYAVFNDSRISTSKFEDKVWTMITLKEKEVKN